LAHAANDVGIVEWSRTLRMDAPPSEALQTRIASAVAHDGVRVQFGPSGSLSRTYVLVEGPAGVDAAEIQQRFPEGTWYGEAIIALAIEPAPADALPCIARVLGGPGAPAGIRSCEIDGTKLVIEFAPSVTQPAMVLRILDVELRRFEGSRAIELLSALPVEIVAAVAAAGLQAPEIAPDRILESLLEAAHVE
jgi:hypothetical protein